MELVLLLLCLCITLAETTVYRNKFAGLATIPLNIPVNTTIAVLNYNTISNITTELDSLHQLQALWLNMNNFDTFPDLSAVGNTLRMISMNANSISSIAPNVLTSLSALRSVSLRFNNLTAFPDLQPVGTTLKILILDHNPITTMPTSLLENLTALETLSITYCSLTQLPSLCAQKDTMQSFNASNNPIINSTEWVNSMEQCNFTQLHSIYAESIQMSVMPTFGSWCPSLKILSVPQNNIVSLNPTSLIKCTNLETLALSGNQISALSGILLVAPTVMYLDMVSNQINDTSSLETSKFVNLKSVMMGTNQLTHMPNFSASATNITSMYFNDNNIRIIDPVDLNAYSAVTVLRLENNLLTEFPNVDGPGSTLTTLYLGGNLFTAFPKMNRIGRSLVELRLENNPGITVMSPSDIEGLSTLTKLYLSGTSLDNVPDLHSLINLQYLYLSETAKPTPIRNASPYAMASLGSLDELYLENTLLDYLPSPCPKSTFNIYLGSSIGEGLCTCGMAWLKKIDMTVYVDDVMCTALSKMWSVVTLDELIALCDSPQPGCQTGMYLHQGLPDRLCSWPYGADAAIVNLVECRSMCLNTIGCQGYQFRPLDSDEGDCLLVSVGTSPSPYNMTQSSNWTYYAPKFMTPPCL